MGYDGVLEAVPYSLPDTILHTYDFNAVMKMCMAMKYHPLQDHPQVDDGGYMMPEKPGVSPGTAMFHFDIDPQNGRLHLVKDFD